MNPQRWQEIDTILDEVLDAAPPQRQAVVERLCPEDNSLRREVLSLLAATENSGSFIDHSPSINSAWGALENAALENSVKSHIGHYRIVREVGRGGMGIVYLAERDDGEFTQEVAIKLVYPHLLNPVNDQLIQRFRRERQILATLNHPHIAQLLDGGTTENGLPFVVMEYVTGVPVTQYCAEQNLNLKQRLRLFQQICDAVKFAHQNLIIHRDLKPGNILVTNDGSVKLLDFGIAKLLSAEEPLNRADSTRTLTMMTPEYASPEQLRGETVTTTTDVYSLGLVLYELLTAQRAYRINHLSLTQMIKVVCEEEPRKPSAAQNLSGKQSTELRGDLDTIMLTALQKESKARYQSVLQFSEDIARYSDGLPVLARTSTFRYRADKFLRRNKKYVIAATLIILSLLGGIVTTRRQANIAHELAASRRRVLYTAHIPAKGEEDLRGFEWKYFWRLLNNNQEMMALIHPKGVYAAAYSPDNTNIATAGEDKIVRVWNTSDGGLLLQLSGHSDIVKHVSYSPDGTRILSSSVDSTARIWDAKTGQELIILKGHQAKVNRAFFSPDGNKIATCSDDSLWKLWDAATGKELFSTKGHDNLTRAIAFSPDGKIIATGGNLSSVKLWDAQTGQQLPFVGNQSRWQCWAVTFSPDGTKLAASGITPFVKVWDLKTNQEIGSFPIEAGWVEGLAFSPDSKQLAGSADKRIAIVWDVEMGRRLTMLKGHTNEIPSIMFSRDGTKLLTAALDNTARVWDLQKLLNEGEVEQLPENFTVVGYSPDRQYFVRTENPNFILLSKVNDKQLIQRIPSRQGFISKIVFSPNGQRMATGGVDQTIRVVEINTTEERFNLKGHTGEISALTYSPQGDWIAAGASDNRLSLWNAESGELRFMSQPLPSFINKIAFSADQHFLATGSFDNQVRIWGVNGQLVKTLSGHQRIISAIAFSPDGKFLASGSEDDTVHIRDVKTGALLHTIHELLGHITALVFSPDGSRLVLGSEDGFVSLWDTSSRLEVLTRQSHRGSVFYLDFTPDGKTLITGDRKGTLQFWRTE